MNGGKLAKGDRRGGFSDRPALRFAQNARPTASQGEAPARAIGKTEERRVHAKILDQTDRSETINRGEPHKLETVFTQNT